MKFNLIILALVFIQACSVNKVKMNSTFDRNDFTSNSLQNKKHKALKKSNKRNKSDIDVTEKCKVSYLKISDSRNKEHSLGSAAFTFLEDGNFDTWFNTGIKALSNNKYIVVNNDADSNVQLIIDLKKAYITSAATSKISNIVVKATIANATNKKTYVVRGNDTSINWWGTQDELQESLNQSLYNLIINLESHISQYC